MGVAGEAQLQDAIARWSAFAEKRRLRFFIDAGRPACDGRAHGTDVVLTTVGGAAGGFRTRATAIAKIALRGNVRVAPPRMLRMLVRHIWRARFFADADLDRRLVVKSSSRPLAQTIVDERVVETLARLAPRRVELGYASGAISVEWAGMECEDAVLDDVLDVLAHLAVRSSEASPYR